VAQRVMVLTNKLRPTVLVARSGSWNAPKLKPGNTVRDIVAIEASRLPD
jgi:hypothetical protein